MRYGERLAEIGAVPSIGSVGDSFDNALDETVNGYWPAAQALALSRWRRLTTAAPRGPFRPGR
jgi:hypothetical protein